MVQSSPCILELLKETTKKFPHFIRSLQMFPKVHTYYETAQCWWSGNTADWVQGNFTNCHILLRLYFSDRGSNSQSAVVKCWDFICDTLSTTSIAIRLPFFSPCVINYTFSPFCSPPLPPYPHNGASGESGRVGMGSLATKERWLWLSEN